MAAKSRKKKLADQLSTLLSDIDEEGLLFLLKQANTLIYNQKVDELNHQAEELEKTGSPSSRGDEGKSKKRSTKAKTSSGYKASVERGAFGTSYILALETARKTFSEQELLRLVNVCHAAADQKDGASRVYTWLKRNRDDVLLDAGISSSRHPALPAVYSILRKNFKVRQ